MTESGANGAREEANMPDADKIIVTCAVTGGAPNTPQTNPNVPVTPEEIAEACIGAWRAGAAITHIHVRDPATKGPSMAFEHYQEVVERIRRSNSDVVINLTTGPGASFIPGKEDPKIGDPASRFFPPEVRTRHVEELKPEICSLDVATLNRRGNVFLNFPDHLKVMAERIRAVGVKPELEVFDIGHIMLANEMVASGLVEGRPMYQLCTGTSYGVPSRIETIIHMRDLLPKDAIWAGFGISRFQMPMAAAICQLGGHVRVGMEDNIYLERGVLAPSNAALVEKAVQIIELLGYQAATPDEAREILGLRGAQ